MLTGFKFICGDTGTRTMVCEQAICRDNREELVVFDR